MIYIKSDIVLDQIPLIQGFHMPSATVTEVARNFAEYVNRVAYRGERFTLMRGGKPVAELAPVTRGVPIHEIPAIFASLPRLTPAEAEEFARDLEAARAELGRENMRDPWES
jgi:antitoxin (DNA-binding transcriptional repressor) of toxin-antitoxin stability system